MISIPIAMGTIAMLSRVSKSASLVSQHTAMSGWTRQSALNGDETRRPSLGKSFRNDSPGPNEPNEPGKPIPEVNFAQEKADISQWDVSGAVDMRALFKESSLSGDISTWDLSGVKMFPTPQLPSTPFDVDTSKWELSLLKDAQNPQVEPPSADTPSAPAP